MKKVLTLLALAAALTGCNIADDYNIEATRAQAVDECQRFNGERTVMALDYAVRAKPWSVTCVNTTTGNSFTVYVTGVLK